MYCNRKPWHVFGQRKEPGSQAWNQNAVAFYAWKSPLSQSHSLLHEQGKNTTTTTTGLFLLVWKEHSDFPLFYPGLLPASPPTCSFSPKPSWPWCLLEFLPGSLGLALPRQKSNVKKLGELTAWGCQTPLAGDTSATCSSLKILKCLCKVVPCDSVQQQL